MLAFHVSLSANRASIEAHGLDSRRATTRPYANDGDDPYEPGNYLHLDRTTAFSMAQSLTEMDVYAVDCDGLALRDDPQHSGVSARTDPADPIAPERLTLLCSTDENGEFDDHVDDPEAWTPQTA